MDVKGIGQDGRNVFRSRSCEVSEQDPYPALRERAVTYSVAISVVPRCHVVSECEAAFCFQEVGMPVYDAIFYVMDIFLLVLLGKMMMNSRKVVLEIKLGRRWAIPVLFLIVAAVGAWRYDGIFRIVQTGSLILFAFMYWNMKSGLAEDGIVTMGSFTPYSKAGTITLNKRQNCIMYENRGRQAILPVDPDQIPEIREFLRNKSKAMSR